MSGNSHNFTVTDAIFRDSGDFAAPTQGYGGSGIPGGRRYFDFDGTNDFAQGSAFNFGTNSFTIGMWCMITSFDVLNDAFFSTRDTGAASNFSSIPDAGKYFLSLLMLIGRLELLTFLLILTPAFWKFN